MELFQTQNTNFIQTKENAKVWIATIDSNKNKIDKKYRKIPYLREILFEIHSQMIDLK